MKTNQNNESVPDLSENRIDRIKEQGYDQGFSNEDICNHAAGNRFAYQMCTLLFTTGQLLTNIPVLIAAVVVAAGTVVLPYHPFDYVYNYGVRQMLDRPKLPKRSVQAKFACGIAAIWLSGIIYLFDAGMYMEGYILGAILFVVAFLVSVFDICIPSKIFNALFRRKRQPAQ